MAKIRIALIGLGNCASSLVQGMYYYKNKNPQDAIGLMYWDIGGYRPYDIEVVAAVDVDRRKVGKDLSDAIFSEPNCTKVFCKDIPRIGINVIMGKVSDGVAQHMKELPDNQTFVISQEKEANIVDVLNEQSRNCLKLPSRWLRRRGEVLCRLLFRSKCCSY